MPRFVFLSLVLALLVSGCNSDKAAAAAQDAPCDAVVAKLASFEPSSGEPEKKLWTKACAGMPPAMRACLVASKTKEERDACGKDQKAVR